MLNETNDAYHHTIFAIEYDKVQGQYSETVVTRFKVLSQSANSIRIGNCELSGFAHMHQIADYVKAHPFFEDGEVEVDKYLVAVNLQVHRSRDTDAEYMDAGSCVPSSQGLAEFLRECFEIPRKENSTKGDDAEEQDAWVEVPDNIQATIDAMVDAEYAERARQVKDAKGVYVNGVHVGSFDKSDSVLTRMSPGRTWIR